MEQNKITLDDLKDQNMLIRGVFVSKYPMGVTVETLKEQAASHGWIRRLLKDLGVD